ncbi:GNAT family N-acetyltransferase [Candidatus Curtissbacteria bacterium]|nr:GNAT family N-acetyltransferase [Candidatus Curtissbacteria bacterium]
MKVELATKEDINGILSLQTQIYRVDLLPDNAKIILSQLFDSNSCDVLVAKENNQIVGSVFIFYLPIPAHGKPYAFLEGLVVDKNHRNKGIGTALAQKAIELARQKNCYKMIFTSGLNRQDLHKFYQKLGFSKWGFEFRMDLS